MTGVAVNLRMGAILVAVIALLPSLHPASRKSVLGRLLDDPQGKIRRFAARWVDDRQDGGDDVPDQLNRLGSKDYATWNDAVQRLGSGGARVIVVLPRAKQLPEARK